MREAFPGYLVLEPLGSGGIATVYRAVEESSGREVALKALQPQLVHAATTRARFEREFELLSTLHHPSLVRAGELRCDYQGAPFFTLELIAGETLERYLSKRVADLSPSGGVLAPNLCSRWILTSIAIVERVADALAYVHQQGLIYCDLKPSNVMISFQGDEPRVTLLDFGLAVPIGGEDLLHTGALVGTSLYMSPEQALGKRPTKVSDIYSLGVLAYELLTLQTPFASPELYEVTASHLLGEVVDPRTRNGAVSKPLARLVRVCLAKDPADRYQEMREITERLSRMRRAQRDPCLSSPCGIFQKLRGAISKISLPFKGKGAVDVTPVGFGSYKEIDSAE
jgi:serine/threonine protein kinase